MPAETPFAALVAVCGDLEATSRRLAKRRRVAEFLRSLPPEEVAPAVLLLVGRIFPERDAKVLNVGWATLQGTLGGPRQATLTPRPLTIRGVQRAFDDIAKAAGPDSTRRRRRLLETLLGSASPSERTVLLRSIFGEMRHGVSEGVMLEAIADAARVDADLVRAAHMFLGDLGKVAALALTEGKAGLEAVGLRLFAPLKPMMAEMGDDMAAVLAAHGGRTALEYKFDGARIQIHRRGDVVRVFSRRLTDVTASVPEVSALAKDLPAASFVLEGEVVAVDDAGRPRPFQDLMRRFRRIHDVEALRREIPLRLYLFDLLHVDGEDVLQAPYATRWERLAALVPPALLATRRLATTVEDMETFLREAMAAGHEGVMAKRLDAPYVPGKRGKHWFKIKPVDHLDVVVVAAEWGHGRRQGWLSNYHLAVRDEAGGHAMVGKTFKGLTDAEFDGMTRRLLALKIDEDRHGVSVRPEVVVEVAYSEIQRSPHYPSGFALRFARITRIRDDKGADEVATLRELRARYARQFARKGKTREPASGEGDMGS
jgi:DNA ligase-1